MKMKLNISVEYGRTIVSNVLEKAKNTGLTIESETESIGKIANEVLSYVYSSRGAFMEGFVRVKSGQRWGFVNFALEEVVSPVYGEAGDVHEGYARVRMNGKWKLLEFIGRDIPAELHNERDFDDASDVCNGLSRVCIDGKYGFYSPEQGKMVIPCIYEDARIFTLDRDYTAVMEDGLWGLVRMDGEIIVEPVFDQIVFTDNRFSATIDGTRYVGGPDGEYYEAE